MGKIILYGCMVSLLLLTCGNNVFNQLEYMRDTSDRPIDHIFSQQQPVAQEDEIPQLTVYDFKMEDTDTAGWKQSTYSNSFRVVEGDSLFDVINGGAQKYIDHGYLKALRQEMEGPEDQKLEIMVTDFGTAQKAETFFNFMRTNPDTANVKVPGYDSTMVIGYENIGGITLFIRYEHIYIDILLDGFYIDSPITTIAKSFIDLLFKKAGILGTGVKVRRR